MLVRVRGGARARRQRSVGDSHRRRTRAGARVGVSYRRSHPSRIYPGVVMSYAHVRPLPAMFVHHYVHSLLCQRPPIPNRQYRPWPRGPQQSSPKMVMRQTQSSCAGFARGRPLTDCRSSHALSDRPAKRSGSWLRSVPSQSTSRPSVNLNTTRCYSDCEIASLIIIEESFMLYIAARAWSA
jgi:hypothetical protein